MYILFRILKSQWTKLYTEVIVRCAKKMPFNANYKPENTKNLPFHRYCCRFPRQDTLSTPKKQVANKDKRIWPETQSNPCKLLAIRHKIHPKTQSNSVHIPLGKFI